RARTLQQPPTHSFTEKIKSRPIYLKPTSTSTAQQTRRASRELKLKQRKRQKPAPLSSRQKRSLCLYDLPPSSQKYAIYEPLHKMWLGYIREVLNLDEGNGKGLPVTAATAAKLTSADYHGAELEVVRSRCVSRVGLRGIVVRDLRGVFELVTERDVVKTVPKEGTIFRFTVPLPEPLETDKAEGKEKEKDLIFELHGSQFQVRAADRANRKFKPHFLPDL
ncbi:Ribonuclease P protein subunit p29, partial [Lachnellula suecica]